MTTIADLEQRLADLEARLGPVPLAVPPITIGELTDVPAPGSPVASQWAQEASARIFHRFPTPAARAAAFTVAPAKGTASYLQTGDGTEGPEWFDGVSWRKAWSMPWGVVGSSSIAVNQNGISTTTVDVTGFTTVFTAVAGRIYRVDFLADINTPTAGSTSILQLVDGTTNLGNIWISSVLNANASLIASGAKLIALTAGSHTIKMVANSAGGNLNILNATVNGQWSVSDAGPSLASAPTLLAAP